MEFNEDLYKYLESNMWKGSLELIKDDNWAVFVNIIYSNRTVHFKLEEINFTYLKNFCDADSNKFSEFLNTLLNDLPDMLKREQTIEKLLSHE